MTECLRAVLVVCAAVAEQKCQKFWDRADIFPLVSLVEGADPCYKVDLVKGFFLPNHPFHRFN